MTIGLDMVFLSFVVACYATSKNIEGCSRKFEMATAAAPVTVASVGSADKVISVLQLTSGMVRSRTTCLTSSSSGCPVWETMSPHDMRRVECIDDVDCAVSDISRDFRGEFRGCFVSGSVFGEQRGTCLCVRHGFASGNDIRLLVEHFVDCIGRAVTFETSVIAAVAGFAVDVNGDVSDFGGGAVGAVIDRAIVDDAKTDAFAEQIVGEGSLRTVPD